MARSALRFFTLVLATALLSACASNVVTVQDDTDMTIAADNGYVLIGIDSSQSLNMIEIEGVKKVRLGADDLRYGSHFLLFELPPGNYRISYISVQRFSGIQLADDNLWNLQVAAGRINYVGDLYIKTHYLSNSASLAVNNKAAHAYQFLLQRFPALLAANEVVYSGPGEDFFLPYIQQQGE